MDWQEVAVGYVSYLAVVSIARREFARARRPLLFTVAGAWGALAIFIIAGRPALPPALGVVLPSLVLLTGYWLSGLFFVRPDTRIERWLLSADQRVLTRSGVLAWFRTAPLLVTEYFELTYLLVYLAVPAGAATLALGGHADQIGRFWTVVLLAEFACYGMLPWIQTRPPRVLESWGPPSPGAEARSAKAAGGPNGRGTPIRRLNHAIVSRASIQANTVPSGHAAGALATALAVGATMPTAGAVFLVLAVSIAAATVLGRYHYVVDTVLGVLVAFGVWLVVS
jgi:membrane-associated phospholipid phosphatase